MSQKIQDTARKLFGIDKPLAITMWDFSWMERRWPGAGFEDWDVALSELKERGYDAVRIEAYPQLVAKDFKDFLAAHIWMAQISDYYEHVGYHYERFEDTGYTNMALKGEKVYKDNEQHYRQCLIEGIEKLAQWSKNSGKPLITTECWAGIATSNFCAPQFVGMWREKKWHLEMTDTIHGSWK